ncbi:hypothetical protein Pla175_30460 [Pirellulimonas nuda]|uniref:PEP-CTERM protein-sorting domain-containing protein n=2 Tax=Pirellulimonas nuda TaxID=2528009 RepID=A0A518DDV3_9BACT|nr:hypothetical protein Pla175_30460 [Pirellulimonas nuda]
MKAYHAILVFVGVLGSASALRATDLMEAPGVDSFSSDYQNPTLFALAPGSNFVSGQVGRIVDEFTDSGALLENGADAGTDGDYFRLIVPGGYRLEQIFVNRYNDFGRGFAAYAPGDAFAPPVDLGGGNVFYPFADAALFDGATDFEPLPPNPLFRGGHLPVDPGDGGFNVDFLPAGSYALLIQENQISTVDYELHFVVTAVPEPASAPLALLLLLGACARRRRSARQTRQAASAEPAARHSLS